MLITEAKNIPRILNFYTSRQFKYGYLIVLEITSITQENIKCLYAYKI